MPQQKDNRGQEEVQVRVKLDVIPYKNGLWCVGKTEVPQIDVTCKDSKKQEFIDGKPLKKIVFKGSLIDCNNYYDRKKQHITPITN